MCAWYCCFLFVVVYSTIVRAFSISWFYVFFFKQKTAYEMRISDWSSDVCSSDLQMGAVPYPMGAAPAFPMTAAPVAAAAAEAAPPSAAGDAVHSRLVGTVPPAAEPAAAHFTIHGTPVQNVDVLPLKAAMPAMHPVHQPQRSVALRRERERGRTCRSPCTP